MKLQDDLLFAFILSVIITYFAWKKGFYRFPLPGASVRKISFSYPLLSFCIYFLGMIVISPFIYLSLKKINVPHYVAWTQILTLPLLTFIFLIYLSLIDKKVRNFIFTGEENASSIFLNFFKNSALGIFTWPVCYPVVLFINILLQKISWSLWGIKGVSQEAVEMLKKTKETSYIFGALSLVIVFIVPFVEELIFRGFLQSFLRYYLGRWASLIGTALIFAAFHYGPKQGIGNVELLISLFVLSLYLCFLYERQKNLWASYSLHALFNGMSILNLSIS